MKFNSFKDSHPKVWQFYGAGLAAVAAAVAVPAITKNLEIDFNAIVFITVLSFAALIVRNVVGIISVLLAWLGFILFSGYALVLAAQFLCGSCFSPPLTTFGCLISPFEDGCAEAQKGLVAYYVTDKTMLASLEKSTPVTRSLLPEQTAMNKTDVLVNYAGDVEDGRINTIATKLNTEGWNIANASGTRTNSAFGVNEVRVFHEKDLDLAKRLAVNLAGLWPESKGIAVRDLSGTKFAVPEKELEIWISK